MEVEEEEEQEQVEGQGVKTLDGWEWRVRVWVWAGVAVCCSVLYCAAVCCSEGGRGMGWLWSVGSMKLWVSFAEYRLFYRALLQKRLIILSILLTEATPYELHVYR